MAFWHPRGLALCRVLEQAARDALSAEDYAEVRGPQVLRQPIWEASGHWQHFAEGIFKLEQDDGQPRVRCGPSIAPGMRSSTHTRRAPTGISRCA